MARMNIGVFASSESSHRYSQLHPVWGSEKLRPSPVLVLLHSPSPPLPESSVVK